MPAILNAYSAIATLAAISHAQRSAVGPCLER